MTVIVSQLPFFPITLFEVKEIWIWYFSPSQKVLSFTKALHNLHTVLYLHYSWYVLSISHILTLQHVLQSKLPYSLFVPTHSYRLLKATPIQDLCYHGNHQTTCSYSYGTMKFWLLKNKIKQWTFWFGHLAFFIACGIITIAARGCLTITH